MKIAGLQKLTLLDFPEKVACTVFTSGCNLRCPFCHNADLVISAASSDGMQEDELLAFLKSRKGILDGVCITGGEPTLWGELPELIRRVKALGFAVKLDTNGTRPQRLEELLSEGLLDYVAMDIKNSPDRYCETCGGVDCIKQVRESAELLRSSQIPYEFRTTLCHPLHTPEDMKEIGRWLKGAPRYFLQLFVDSGNLIGAGMTPLSEGEMQAMLEAIRRDIPSAQIRGL